MILYYLIPFLIFIPLAILQLTIVPLISFERVSPDLILILLVYYTLKNGQIYGTLLGFSFGFLFDLISGGLLGSSMFAKTLSGFIAGYFYNENKIEFNTKSSMFVIIVLVCALINSFVSAILASTEVNINVVFLFFEQGLLPGIYTSLFSLPVLMYNPRKELE